MDTVLKKITALWLVFLVFSACEKYEMRGFFISHQSADQRFKQSMAWNSAHPFKEINVAVGDYTLFVMSDSHVGGTKNLDLFLEEAIQKNAVAAMMAGDITTGHAEDYSTFFNHLPPQDSLLAFPIVGNHDLYFDGWKQFYLLFGATTYVFKVKTPGATDLFICTDTGSGTLGSNQLTWLKDFLKRERSDYRYCILFTHNNIFRIRHTTSTNPFVEELRILLELCVKHKIDMVVAGHDHKKNVVKFGNTTHITLDALVDDNKQAGYLNLYIHPGRIDYEFIQF